MGLEVAVAALVIGTGVSIQQQRKATEAAEEAEELSTRIQDVKATRERRRQIRAARAARAELVAGAVSTGTTQTSRTAGVGANIAAERAENISFIDTTAGLTRQIGRANIREARARSRASTAQALGQLGFRAGVTADEVGLFDNDDGTTT